jgi:hypothetical protein
MDITHQYPPELLHLLIDTIPLLCQSKKDTILFFNFTGIEKKYFADLEQKIEDNIEEISKNEIVGTILKRLNERGEVTLRERQEILKKVTEFNAFSSCLPDDQLKASELISEIQNLIDITDSFNIETQEHEEEGQKHREEHNLKIKQIEEKKRQLEEVKQKLYSLFSETDDQKRGIILEEILNRLFKINDIPIRESFKMRKEKGQDAVDQIEGEIELEGEFYLVGMKWTNEPTDVGQVLRHLARVYHRNCTRAIFISASGYVKPVISACQEALQNTVIILCTLEEIVKLLENEKDLNDFLKQKISEAVSRQNPFLLILEE